MNFADQTAKWQQSASIKKKSLPKEKWKQDHKTE